MAEIIDVVMRLTDNVTDRLRNIRQGMEQTARANQRLGSTISGVGNSMGAISSAMMPMAAGITAMGTMGVKTFMDFDATITGAAVKAGATTEELNKMREVAGKLGAQFPITANEAAQGMDRLAAGGFNATQAIAAMPGIIEASVASGEDLAATSDVITSALSIWNMTQGDVAANTVKVADVVQAAANSSKLGMQEFGLAMQYAGAPAAALGVSIDELGTAMAIMSNNGIEASTIGTSLRATMSRLASPPKAAAEAIAQLGLKVTDSTGKFLGLENIVGQMRSSMKGLSDVEQVALAKAIAGEDAYSGLLALVNTAPDVYSNMAKAIKDSSGSSHEAYKKMQDTLKGSINSLMGSVEAMGIAFGSALAPSIRAAANELKFIADTFTNLSPATKNLIIQVSAGIIGFTGFMLVASKVVGVVGSMVTMYGQIGRVMAGASIRSKGLQVAVQGVMRGFQLLRTASVAMLGPWGIAIAAIAAAAYMIYKNWDKIGPFFTSLWNRIKGAFYSAVAMIQPALTRLQGIWSRMMGAFQKGAGIFGVLNAATDVLAGVLGGVLGGAIIIVASLLTGTLTTAFNVIGSMVSMAIGVFGGLIDFITGVFTGNWALAWQGVSEVFSSVFDGLSGILSGFIEGARAGINSLIDGINGISIDIPSWVPGFGGQTFGPLNVPHLYTGTSNWQGGPAMVHDRGAEIIDLPQGSRVIPHDASLRNAYNMGKSSAGNAGITVNISGVNINNGNDINEFARKVAERIHYEMEKEAMNRTVGAI